MFVYKRNLINSWEKTRKILYYSNIFLIIIISFYYESVSEKKEHLKTSINNTPVKK